MDMHATELSVDFIENRTNVATGFSQAELLA